jgi:hypothetical protein
MGGKICESPFLHFASCIGVRQGYQYSLEGYCGPADLSHLQESD